MKYKLTDEKVLTSTGEVLYRIEAVRNIYGTYQVWKGQKGGFVSGRKNLSHEGNCWIGGEARVYGEATVCDDALVLNTADVSGKTVLKDKARVSGGAVVVSTQMKELAQVMGGAKVEHSNLLGSAQVSGYAKCTYSNLAGTIALQNKVHVHATRVNGEQVVIMGNASINASFIGVEEGTSNIIVIGGDARIEDARIYGSTVSIGDSAHVSSGVKTLGDSITIKDFASITGEVEILSNVRIEDWASIKNIRSFPLLLDNETISGDVVVEG